MLNPTNIHFIYACLDIFPSSVFFKEWEQMTAISAPQLLLTHFAALHHRSYDSWSSLREYYGQRELMSLIFNWHFMQSLGRLYCVMQGGSDTCSAAQVFPSSLSIFLIKYLNKHVIRCSLCLYDVCIDMIEFQLDWIASLH